MKVAMIGSGYVGLVSGACFAELGHEVVCVDNDPAKIEVLRAGGAPIFEPGLAELIARNRAAGRISFTTRHAEAVAGADAVFIAVGTPSRRGDGHADLSYVYAAARDIAANMTGFTVIVTKSTVPVRTGDEVEKIVRETRSEGDFAVVSNPEFLREGDAIADFMNPDRIVIGSTDERAISVMRDLYRPLTDQGAPLMTVDRRTSELIKYAANAFLAAKITFINEMADLCEKVGGDVEAVAQGIGLDDRIGPRFLKTGPGYGGSCFPKDTLALARTAQLEHAPLGIVESVIASNDQRKRAMARKIIGAMGGDVQGKTIAVLGLAFKKNTDDMRDSPSLDILPALLGAGARVRAFDPEAMHEAAKLLHGVEYAEDALSCAAGADAAVILTEWDVFRDLDLTELKAALGAPLLIDLRNLYEPQTAAAAGLRYVSLGRPEVNPLS